MRESLRHSLAPGFESRILVDLIMHWKHWHQHHSHQNFLWEQASKPAVPSVSVKQTTQSNTKSLIKRTETNCSLNHALCAFITHTQRFNISTIAGYGLIWSQIHQAISEDNTFCKHLLEFPESHCQTRHISIMCDSAWSSWTQA